MKSLQREVDKLEQTVGNLKDKGFFDYLFQENGLSSQEAFEERLWLLDVSLKCDF
jgi:hypothetical protein